MNLVEGTYICLDQLSVLIYLYYTFFDSTTSNWNRMLRVSYSYYSKYFLSTNMHDPNADLLNCSLVNSRDFGKTPFPGLKSE